MDPVFNTQQPAFLCCEQDSLSNKCKTFRFTKLFRPNSVNSSCSRVRSMKMQTSVILNVGRSPYGAVVSMYMRVRLEILFFLRTCTKSSGIVQQKVNFSSFRFRHLAGIVKVFFKSLRFNQRLFYAVTTLRALDSDLCVQL